MIYLDTSVLFALFSPDVFTERAFAFLTATQPDLLISDLAIAELTALVGRRTREAEPGRRLSEVEADLVLVQHRLWSAQFQACTTDGRDIAQATAYLRQFGLGLRTQDAIHIALALGRGARLATCDRRMAASALTLGCPVETC